MKNSEIAEEYSVAVEPFDQEKARRARELEILKRKAVASGVEPFSVEEALKYYYPDELTGDEEKIKKVMAGFESDYYYSGARTLEEWARDREKYDIDKDSTGND